MPVDAPRTPGGAGTVGRPGRTPGRVAAKTPGRPAPSRTPKEDKMGGFLERTAEWERRRQEKLDEIAREEAKKHEWENPNKRKNEKLKATPFELRLREDARRREANKQRLLEEEKGKIVGKPKISSHSKKIVKKKETEEDFVARMRMDEIDRKNRMQLRNKAAEPKPKQSLMSKTSRWLMSHQKTAFLERLEEDEKKRESNKMHLAHSVNTLRERELTGMPKMSEKSEEILMTTKRQSRHGDFFTRMQEAEDLKKRKLEVKKKIMKEARLMEEAAECTFAPQISHRALETHSAYADVEAARRRKAHHMRHLEQEFNKECTFHPDLSGESMLSQGDEHRHSLHSNYSNGNHNHSHGDVRLGGNKENSKDFNRSGDLNRSNSYRPHAHWDDEDADTRDTGSMRDSVAGRSPARRRNTIPSNVEIVLTWYYKYYLPSALREAIYYNPVTMEASTDEPRALDAVIVEHPTSQWFEYFDMDKNRVFYCNGVTGTLQLGAPEGNVISLHKWAYQLEDEQLGRTYFYNPITKEVTWDIEPKGAEIVIDASRAYYAYPSTTSLEDVVTICRARVCSAPMFYNPVLGEITYTLPEGRTLIHVIVGARYEWNFQHYDAEKQAFCYFNPITRALTWTPPASMHDIIAHVPHIPPHDPHPESRHFFEYPEGTGREESYRFYYSLHGKSVQWKEPEGHKIARGHANDWYEVFLYEEDGRPAFYSPVEHALCTTPPPNASGVVLLDGTRSRASDVTHLQGKFENIRRKRQEEQNSFEAAVLQNQRKQQELLTSLEQETVEAPVEANGDRHPPAAAERSPATEEHGGAVASPYHEVETSYIRAGDVSSVLSSELSFASPVRHPMRESRPAQESKPMYVPPPPERSSLQHSVEATNPGTTEQKVEQGDDAWSGGGSSSNGELLSDRAPVNDSVSSVDRAARVRRFLDSSEDTDDSPAPVVERSIPDVAYREEVVHEDVSDLVLSDVPSQAGPPADEEDSYTRVEPLQAVVSMAVGGESEDDASTVNDTLDGDLSILSAGLSPTPGLRQQTPMLEATTPKESSPEWPAPLSVSPLVDLSAPPVDRHSTTMMTQDVSLLSCGGGEPYEADQSVHVRVTSPTPPRSHVPVASAADSPPLVAVPAVSPQSHEPATASAPVLSFSPPACNPSLGESSCDLIVGMDVDVRGHQGTVRYIGPTHKPGLWIGVQMKEPVGFSNGTVRGVVYFECPDRYGKFVKPSSVRKL